MKIIIRHILFLFSLVVSTIFCNAQESIGETKTSVKASLIKSTFKILKITDEKIQAEFPDPKMLYEYYFQNDVCYRYEGLIPVTERDYYTSEMKRNGWVKSSIDGNKEIFKRGGFVLKIITLTEGIGFFKFQIDKL